MIVKKPLDISCRSLFQGNASIGSHIVDQCRATGTAIRIKNRQKFMTLDPIEFYKFFSFGNSKSYPHKNGRIGFYTLKYVKFVPDIDPAEKENDK